MMITVFTPTYNRAHLLHDIYDSLVKQTFTDFEWVVVDDGSKDDTPAVMQRFIDEGKINIRFFRQQNGGKHSAVNHGVKEARGELFLILDSDDALPSNSLATVAEEYNKVKGDKSFGGVCGYMAHRDGTIIGHGYDADVFNATSLEMRCKYGVKGDMAEVFLTEVLREFPFPEIEGERFCPEMTVWDRIAMKYRLRVFHKVIYYRDYLDGGLTDNIVRVRMKSPVTSMICYGELSSMPIPFVQKFKAAANYWRFRFCASREKRNAVKISPFWIIAKPLGWIMHVRERNKI